MAMPQMLARAGLALSIGMLLVGCTQGNLGEMSAASESSRAPSAQRGAPASPPPSTPASRDASAAPSPGVSADPGAPAGPGERGGSGNDGSGSGGSEPGEENRTGQAPAPDPPPFVIGSPLRIPLPTDELGGFVFADRVEDVRRAISFACGGPQCVSVVRVGLATVLAPNERCDTIRGIRGVLKDPPEFRPYVLIASGGTLTLDVNVRCEDVPAPDPAPDPPAQNPVEETPQPERVLPEESVPPAPEDPPAVDPPPIDPPVEGDQAQ